MEKLNVSIEKNRKKKEREDKKRQSEKDKALKAKKRKLNNKNYIHIDKEKIKDYTNILLNNKQNEKYIFSCSNSENIISKQEPSNKESLTNFTADSSLNHFLHAKRNLTTQMHEIAGKSNPLEPKEDDLLEKTKHNFTNTPLFEGICFSCTNNLMRSNYGIRCIHCIRTYHYICIEKHKLHKSNSNIFICLNCLKKNCKVFCILLSLTCIF